ncbi:MAG TPA: tyrosine-type recombinase/integrase [Methylocella sp.]|nr:tyrosine-type recombinase/integrase [Methylocella sp.]
MLYTGQRRSDVHRMTWPDINGDMISVIQQKTGARLVIPLHSGLRDILSHAPRDHVTLLNTEYGKPFTVDGFSGFLRDAIKAAGLPIECHPHGLRKAAGRRLAEAGCTANEIMSVLGHKTLAEAERYTRGADQKRQAWAAILKLERTNGTQSLANPPFKVSQKSDKTKEYQSEQKETGAP